MTRKKFVKQLMAMGYSRNEAESLTGYVRSGCFTYEQRLDIERQFNGKYTAICEAAGKIAAAVIPSLKRMAEAINESAERITEAFNRVMYGIDLANGPDFTAGGGGHV